MGEAAQMSHRDWLAGMAMQSIFRDLRYEETNWAEIVAKNAYDMADAMIRQGKKRGTP
jgi:hypothetical protein